MKKKPFLKPEIGEVARLFLKLGFTAFGGPAAHLAIMEDEVVKRRGWVSREKFLDLWAAAQMIPGPNSTEMAIHIGFLRAGWPGLIAGGLCFILPAVGIVTALAWFYVHYQSLPELQAMLYGMKPAVLAVIVLSLGRFSRTAFKTKKLFFNACGACFLYFYGIHEIMILIFAALLNAVAADIRGFFNHLKSKFHFFIFGILPATAEPAWPVVSPHLQGIFFSFLKIGSVLFGSGYVLLPFLKADFVERLHWLTDTQLLDAIAVGQVTPGPLFTTATFAGYVMAGWGGAMAATIGIFLPAFVFVALSGPLVPKLRASKIAGNCLDGINAASVALMAGATIDLGRGTIHDVFSGGLFAASFAALVFFRLPATWLIPISGLAGILIQLATGRL